MVVQNGVLGGEFRYADIGIAGKALVEHNTVLYMSCQLGILQSDGILAFDDSDFTARGHAFAIGQLDIACGINAGAALAGGVDFGAVYDDIAFTAVGGQCAAVGAFRGDIYIFGCYGATVSGIQPAGGIVFGMDFDVLGLDLCLLACGKNRVGPISIGKQREIFQYSCAVIG